MLLPDSRTIAFELIRPPTGYRLDFAVLTTYTLDLEALLVLPLSLLAHPDGGLDKLLEDPLRLHQAIREAGDRVHAFVDETGIAVPHGARPLYSMLESSVHAVRAPSGGSFHPKVWAARFTAASGEAGDAEYEAPPDLLRVAILSRNLTFDRSWDVALASEAPRRDVKRRVGASRPLGDFLSALPQLAATPMNGDLVGRVQTLADQVARAAFPAPDGFDSPIAFHALGLLERPRTWHPPSSGYRTLAIAPFVNRKGLDAVGELSDGERILVSRQEELDKLSTDALAHWNEQFVLRDTAQGESEDETAEGDGPEPAATARPAGLHAKMFAVEHGFHVTWYVGSANLTAAAFEGRNVEMMASITGRKGREGGNSGHGIARFLDGFQKLCVPYERSEPPPEDGAATSARARLEKARDALVDLVDADLRVVCASEGDLWRLTIAGAGAWPGDDVEAVAWPISIPEKHACPFGTIQSWRLPVARLTAFIAFRLHVPVRGVDDIRLTLRLQDKGMPEDRMHQVLRALLDSPEKFLRFLRALLGGLDATVDWARDAGDGSAADWGIGLGGETLLDDLVRTAARDPGRLKPVRRLIDDLRKTEEGRRIVPDDLFQIWRAVEEALAQESRP